MRSSWGILIIVAAVLSRAESASAVTLLLENPTTSGNGWTVNSVNPYYAESISLASGATITRLGFYQVTDNSNPDLTTVAFRIWSFSDGSTPPQSGTLLGTSGSVPLVLETRWVEEDLASPVALAAGQYWIGVQWLSGTGKAFNGYNGNPYAGGGIYASLYGFTYYDSYEAPFRVYGPDPAPVPEAGGPALAAIAVLATALARLRRPATA